MCIFWVSGFPPACARLVSAERRKGSMTARPQLPVYNRSTEKILLEKLRIFPPKTPKNISKVLAGAPLFAISGFDIVFPQKARYVPEFLTVVRAWLAEAKVHPTELPEEDTTGLILVPVTRPALSDLRSSGNPRTRVLTCWSANNCQLGRTSRRFFPTEV